MSEEEVACMGDDLPDIALGERAGSVVIPQLYLSLRADKHASRYRMKRAASEECCDRRARHLAILLSLASGSFKTRQT
jgi:3-deoxy-D-manno-octulosonate 8-phosphate phosphatase KdsC-like HAD superfamily phosphatase